MINKTPILSQEEIDNIYNTMPSGKIDDLLFSPTAAEEKKNTIMRTTQEIYPIYYYGDKIPSCYGIRTNYEYLDKKTNQWYHAFHSEKLIYNLNK
jgi:hypothetical protein